jgi:hypothetical protein
MDRYQVISVGGICFNRRIWGLLFLCRVVLIDNGIVLAFITRRWPMHEGSDCIEYVDSGW